LIKELARGGIAAIVVSSDLPEIISISDRVLVVRSGRIAAELRGDEINEETIMLHATGQAGNGAAGEVDRSRE
jgi:ABC-type sugar transport system ATPase subunit